jgi:hypothetical protein
MNFLNCWGALAGICILRLRKSKLVLLLDIIVYLDISCKTLSSRRSSLSFRLLGTLDGFRGNLHRATSLFLWLNDNDFLKNFIFNNDAHNLLHFLFNFSNMNLFLFMLVTQLLLCLLDI